MHVVYIHRSLNLKPGCILKFGHNFFFPQISHPLLTVNVAFEAIYSKLEQM